MGTAAQRMRLLRQRVRQGRIVVSLEIDEEHIEALHATGLLDPLVDPCRGHVADAIKRLLKTIRCEACRVTTPNIAL